MCLLTLPCLLALGCERFRFRGLSIVDILHRQRGGGVCFRLACSNRMQALEYLVVYLDGVAVEFPSLSFLELRRMFAYFALL